MTTHLVTFSDESMSRARRLCSDSGLAHGIDSAARYDDEMLTDRWDWNPDWSAQRGFGYWRWKPLLIETQIRQLSDNDTLIYADAGVEFINNVNYIIDRMGHEKPQDDIWLFGNNWEHAHWCKRDVVQAIWPSKWWRPNLEFHSDKAVTWERFGKQVQASVIFLRVSEYSRRFVSEWLDWCLTGVRIGAAVSFGRDNPEHRDGRMTWSKFRYLIDDSESVFPNHPEFREHRHDQAILTTLAYREGIKLHYWPAVYNKGGTPEFVYEKLPEYAGDDYPSPLFSHHRKRDHEWERKA